MIFICSVLKTVNCLLSCFYFLKRMKLQYTCKYSQTVCEHTPSGLEKSVRLTEVSAYWRSKMQTACVCSMSLGPLLHCTCHPLQEVLLAEV